MWQQNEARNSKAHRCQNEERRKKSKSFETSASKVVDNSFIGSLDSLTPPEVKLRPSALPRYRLAAASAIARTHL